jgi:nucleotide-binding universal stress UspA family protein
MPSWKADRQRWCATIRTLGKTVALFAGSGRGGWHAPPAREVVMINIRRILCPTDFSDFSQAALDHAVALSRSYGSRLSVLHVTPLMPSVSGTAALAINPITLEPRSHEQMVEMVRDFAEPAFRAGLDPDCLVREGPIVPEILAEAKRARADLVTLGTHGRGGFERFILGSVAEKVLHKAPCPVLTVGRRAQAAAPRAAADLRSILCPVDFSPTSRLALSHALSLAERSKARLTLLYVLEWTQSPIRAPQAESLTRYREQLQEDALHELRAAVPAGARDWCDVHERVALGTPWRRIVHAMSEEHADLAVLGVQGASRAEQVVFGSVVNEVVRHATCPVLTVRQPEHEP